MRFAHDEEFDSLLAENWYKISVDAILSRAVRLLPIDNCVSLTYVKGAHRMLIHHNTFPNALAELFTEVKFDIAKFSPSMRNFRRKGKEKLRLLLLTTSYLGGGAVKKKLPIDTPTQRRMLENFASRYQFDALYPENWYRKLLALAKDKVCFPLQFAKLTLVQKFRNISLYYQHIPAALSHIFPDLTIEPSKFPYANGVRVAN